MPNINTDHIFNHSDIKQIEEAARALRRVRASEARSASAALNHGLYDDMPAHLDDLRSKRVAELCRELADKMS